MPSRTASLPFVLVRQQQVIGTEITTTTEEIHGLLHVEGDRLRVQWRVARATRRVGMEIRTDVELQPVSEAEVALTALAAAEVRQGWWKKLVGGAELVLRAADLRAFEAVAGAAGMSLQHPAELVIPVRRADRDAAQEFAVELELAIAERALESAPDQPALPPDAQ